MTRKPFITNPSLTAAAAVFVFVGILVQVSSQPAGSSFNPIPYPADSSATTSTIPSAVLSEETKSPSLDLAPIQPDTRGTIGETLIQIAKSLTGQDDLSSVLSSDLASTYSPDEIKSALAAALNQYGSVQSLWTIGDPNVTGDYADQGVEVTTSTGKYRFQLFLHRENGTWKLMGTEPLP